MKKLIILILILQACTNQKVQNVNSNNAKILLFLKHSDSDNNMNKAKLKNWKNSLQNKFPNLYFVGKSYNVESSLNFAEQLKIRKNETKPKYILTYEFIPAVHSTKNKYVFNLSDSTRLIKDKVYNNLVLLSIKDVANDFKILESLK